MTTPLPTIRILKPGTFIDAHGTKVAFTDADLAGVASSYDASSDPAPIVLGHPKMDTPAFGWIGKVEIVDGELVATPSNIAPALAEAIEAQHYRKVSASLYPPSAANNPKPGSWYLKHLGFLGAAAPAIKGLGTVAFADGDEAQSITIDIEPEKIMADTPDTVALAERETALNERETALNDRETSIDAREAEAATAAKAALHTANVAFADGMIAEAKLAPAGKALLVGVLDQLEATAVVSFGEGDGAVEMAPAAALKQLLSGATPIVALGEAAPDDGKQPGDIDPVSLAEEISTYHGEQAQAGRHISFTEAAAHVRKQHAS